MRKIIFSIVFILAIISSMLSLNAFAAEIADGTYEVNIALWHSEDDKESMAADSVGKKATIVVENGIKTMHITSGEMSMMGIKASLQELRIADAKGNYTDAKVESKDSEGNPTGFYFTMPHNDKYITVKVNPHLAIMGNKDIGARIKVDYSSLKLIKPAEAVMETAAEVSGAISTEDEEVTQTITEATEITVQETISETLPIESTTAQTDVQDSSSDNNTAIVVTILVAAAAIVLITIKSKRNR